MFPLKWASNQIRIRTLAQHRLSEDSLAPDPSRQWRAAARGPPTLSLDGAGRSPRLSRLLNCFRPFNRADWRFFDVLLPWKLLVVRLDPAGDVDGKRKRILTASNVVLNPNTGNSARLFVTDKIHASIYPIHCHAFFLPVVYERDIRKRKGFASAARPSATRSAPVETNENCASRRVPGLQRCNCCYCSVPPARKRGRNSGITAH